MLKKNGYPNDIFRCLSKFLDRKLNGKQGEKAKDEDKCVILVPGPDSEPEKGGHMLVPHFQKVPRKQGVLSKFYTHKLRNQGDLKSKKYP